MRKLSAYILVITMFICVGMNIQAVVDHTYKSICPFWIGIGILALAGLRGIFLLEDLK